MKTKKSRGLVIAAIVAASIAMLVMVGRVKDGSRIYARGKG